MRQKGSHHSFTKAGAADFINIQPNGSKAKSYSSPADSGNSATEVGVSIGNPDQTPSLMKATARDYEVNIWWSEQDQFFVAQVVEMPGVMADGPTRAKAAHEIEAALEATIEAAQAHGHALPEPRRLSAVDPVGT